MNLKYSYFFIVVTIAVLFSGCSSMFVNKDALTLDDIISMSRAEVSDSVIESQIDISRTRFKLKPEDIILLKKEGVSEDVIKYMVESGEYDSGYYGYPYDYWFDYSYSYGYPYYYYGRPYWRTYGYWGVPYRTPGMIGRYYRGYPYYGGGRYRDYDDSRDLDDSGRRPEIQRNPQDRGQPFSDDLKDNKGTESDAPKIRTQPQQRDQENRREDRRR